MPEPSSIPSGGSFGSYILDSPLARGGMAEVFVARRRYGAGIEKPVALKRIRPEFSQDASFSALFLQEARIALRLNHPNVVQVYDFGELDGQLFLAMERVDGWDLRRLRHTLRRRRQLLPVPLALYIAWSVCRALDYAHTRTDADGKAWGLVHQDVGHPNILIAWDGTVKLTDFGVARLQAEGPGQQRGRPGYMSPEQLRGEEVDQRSDLYSLGVVLFELLTGQHLFGGGDPANTLWRSLHHPPPPPSSLRPELKAEVDSLLLSMLQRDREQRVGNARILLPLLRREMNPLGPEEAAEALGSLLKELEDLEVSQEEEDQTVLQPDATTDLRPDRSMGSEAEEEVADASTELLVLGSGTAPTLAPAATHLSSDGQQDKPSVKETSPSHPPGNGDQLTSVTDILPAPPPPRPSRTVAVIRSVVRARWVVPPEPDQKPAFPQEKTISARRRRTQPEGREALLVVVLALVLILGLLGAWWGLRPSASPKEVGPPVAAALPTPDAPAGPQPLIVRSLKDESSVVPTNRASPVGAATAPIPALPPSAASPDPGPAPETPPVPTAEAAASPPDVVAANDTVPTMATLDIRVREGWGKVRIDGKAWKGATPLLGVELSPGRHLIQVEIPSTGRIYSRELVLSAGQRQVVEFGP